MSISDNDVSLWRGLQTTPADVEQDEGSRTSRLLSSILDELRQLTGKVERDEARQDEIHGHRAVCFEEDAERTRPGVFEKKTDDKDKRGTRMT